jgi:hypothetical protein
MFSQKHHINTIHLENQIVFWTLSIVQIKYKNIKSRRFGSWFFFLLQVKGGETPSVDSRCLPSLHLKTEEEPASETL